MKQAIAGAIFIAVTHLCLPGTAGAVNIYSTKSPGDSSMSRIPDVGVLLKDILAVTGLQGDVELKEAKVMNIEAGISHGKRYILYNRSFIERLNSLTKDKWAALALLAHELGHHLNGHTIRKGGSRPAVELEADEFAGFILYKLGATLEQSQLVMHYIAKTEASSTHPGRTARLLAIEKGWNKAAGLKEYTAQSSR